MSQDVEVKPDTNVSVFETGKLPAFVDAIWSGVVAQLEGFAADLLVCLNLRHLGCVVGSALRSSLMGKSTFWVRHFVLLSTSFPGAASFFAGSGCTS